MPRNKKPDELQLSPWSQVGKDRWVRTDNAVVLFDHGCVAVTSKPWLKRPRGWKAFGPGEASYNYLYYVRRRRGGVGAASKVARKWRTARAAMDAVDAAYPVGQTLAPAAAPAETLVLTGS